jgi:hypothetical protein
MRKTQRGQNAVQGVPQPTQDPRWGGLNPGDYKPGDVKLMYHPAYGERFFRNEDVKNRESRGWEVVDYVDPTMARGPANPPNIPQPVELGDDRHRVAPVEAAPDAAPDPILRGAVEAKKPAKKRGRKSK